MLKHANDTMAGNLSVLDLAINDQAIKWQLGKASINLPTDIFDWQTCQMLPNG